MKHIKEIVEKAKSNEEVALASGIDFLEENMGPLYPGELTLICSEINSGKTALMIQQIHRLSIDSKVPVLAVLSGKDEIAFLASMAAYYCSILLKDVRTILSDPLYKDVVENYMELIQQSPIYFISRKEFLQKEGDVSEFVKEKGIKAIFVESLPWMCLDSREKGQLAMKLKELTIDLQVAMIVEYQFRADDDYPVYSIVKFGKNDLAVFADNIIVLEDFLQHRLFLDDEKGYDLRGKLRVKIMKHKGIMARDKEVVLSRIHLLLRDIHNTIGIGDYNSLCAENSAIDNMRRRLDLEVEDIF